jgi:hypothetical protein
MKAFKINVDGRELDYRNGNRLDLDHIRVFFENKGYILNKLIPQERHICAIVTNPELSSDPFFLKLATSEGIGVFSENEFFWNEATSSKLPVPKNYARGYFKKDLFYLITAYLNGKLLDKKLVAEKIQEIIDLSERIMSIKIVSLPSDKYTQGRDHREKFVNKTVSHFEAVPENVRIKNHLGDLLLHVKNNAKSLRCSPRHGDFTPWHMILDEDSINLIDGEHAMSQGIEYYDIAYFIQRVYAVWKDVKLAKSIYQKLILRGYDKNKLKVVLMARSIGGFLDESLAPIPDYSIHEELKEWVLSI